MISQVNMINFKCFEENSLELYPLTLLAGLNSSGKSSVMQAIRLCTEDDFLEGHGGFKELLYKNSSEKNFETSISYEDDSTITFNADEYEYDTHVDGDFYECYYLSADRFGPRTTLPYQEECYSVGKHGEHVYSFINGFREANNVPELLRHEEVPHISGVFEQIRAWIKLISPNAEFDYQVIPKADTSYASFSEFRPTNVGFGLSYTLPIIASILSYASQVVNGEKEFITLLIENPEAHLHPKGQVQLGRFLALASQSGIQLVIETHSEHILNGIRLAIKEKKVKSDSAICYFFEYNEESNTSDSQAIFIDENGMIDYWPDGFFDETEKTLLRIL